MEFARRHVFSPYNPITKRGFLRHLILKESKSTGEIMALLETRSGDIPDLGLLAQTLSRLVPEVKSFYRVTNNKTGDDFHSEKMQLVSGKAFLEEIMNGLILTLVMKIMTR